MKSRKLFGVGVNDANYQVVFSEKRKQVWACPIYKIWVRMLERAYSEKRQARQPYYFGCKVCDEWLVFSRFRDWVLLQDWEGKQLDKDILIPGNREYSPYSCAFVSKMANGFVTESTASRGEFPIGVTFHKRSGRFRALCGNPFTGKQECVGSFGSSSAAHLAWAKQKLLHAVKVAECENKPVADAIIARYTRYLCMAINSHESEMARLLQ